jgi:hypothetical protein
VIDQTRSQLEGEVVTIVEVTEAILIERTREFAERTTSKNGVMNPARTEIGAGVL